MDDDRQRLVKLLVYSWIIIVVLCGIIMVDVSRQLADIKRQVAAQPKSIKGEVGSQGLPGPTGIDGLSIVGSSGAKGDKGETGAVGATGAQGVQGVAGQQGNQGEPGKTIIILVRQSLENVGELECKYVSDTIWQPISECR